MVRAAHVGHRHAAWLNVGVAILLVRRDPGLGTAIKGQQCALAVRPAGADRDLLAVGEPRGRAAGHRVRRGDDIHSADMQRDGNARRICEATRTRSRAHGHMLVFCHCIIETHAEESLGICVHINLVAHVHPLPDVAERAEQVGGELHHVLAAVRRRVEAEGLG